MPEYYKIKIKGHLEGNVTLLSGPLPDQSALHGPLERIRYLNMTLISITCDVRSSQGPGKASVQRTGRMIHIRSSRMCAASQ